MAFVDGVYIHFPNLCGCFPERWFLGPTRHVSVRMSKRMGIWLKHITRKKKKTCFTVALRQIVTAEDSPLIVPGEFLERGQAKLACETAVKLHVLRSCKDSSEDTAASKHCAVFHYLNMFGVNGDHGVGFPCVVAATPAL